MDLSGYMIQGTKDAARVLAGNNTRWITLRWYYMTLLASLAMIVSLMATGTVDKVVEYGAVLLAGYTINLLLLIAARVYRTRLTTQRFVMAGQLLLDLSMCGLVTYIQGGVDARTTLLFAIPIVASGLMFTRAAVLPVAALSSLAYVGIILLHAQLTNGYIDWVESAAPVVFYPLLFLILGRMVEFLTTIEINDARERAYNSFLSLLAHQLKHPASASKTIIDVIEHDKEAGHTEQTRHYLQMLRGESENQIRLIDNLLEAAPRQTFEAHREWLDLTVLLEKAAHQTARGHQRLGDLVKDESAGKPVKVYGNPIKLRLALANIFDNSFRHTTDGAAVHYGLRIVNGTAEIKVSDEGVGMSKKHLETILERFNVSSLHDLGSGHLGGLGLGLYTARQIITAHDGTLEVQSSENKGTTVLMRIKGAKQ